MVEEVNSPMYATGAGLVVCGLKENEYGRAKEVMISSGPPASNSGESTRAKAKEEKKEKKEAAARPQTSFIYKIKDWFENTMSNTGDFIE